MKFKSIKNKLLVIISAGLFLMATAISAFAITVTHNILHSDADIILLEQCETEATKINDALGSVEHSISIMRHYAVTEFDDMSIFTVAKEQEDYLTSLDTMFREIAFNTPETLTYYVRLNQELTSTAAGFYYAVDANSKEVTKLPNTDLSQYSPDNTAEVGWYYLPKAAGEAIWLAPYQQSHNPTTIISYVTPFYMVNGTNKTFIGIIGIDLPYSCLTGKVASISVHDNGTASLSETKPEISSGHNHSEDKTSHAMQPLKNGMYLLLEAKYADIQRESRTMLYVIAATAVAITLIFVIITWYAMGKIITPLNKLARAANEFAEGNYDIDLEYDGNDEIATMAASLKFAASKLKEQMNHVSTLAFHDALTGVRSAAAFNQAVADMNLLLENVHRDFAVVVADVNYLKTTNDTYGHSAGNQLLSYTANVLTETFKNSYVYRVGGDEFAIILDGVDYENRDELLEELNRKSIGSTIKVSENAEIAVSFAFGMATYTKELDAGFDDVLKHADSAMYLHKRTLKRAQLKAHPTEQQ